MESRPDPTPEQIAAATAKIRSTWSLETFQDRAAFYAGRRAARREFLPRIISTDGIELPDDE